MATGVVEQIGIATRRKFTAEVKIRVVLKAYSLSSGVMPLIFLLIYSCSRPDLKI